MSLSEASIKNTALSVYQALVHKLKLKPEQIIIFGRSMGSGPACFLAHERPCGALILFAPYHSIKFVAKEHVGCISCCAPNMFRNIDYISKIVVPTVIIHGKQDEVISHGNGAALFKASGALESDKMFVNPADMGHNEFAMSRDVIIPIESFLTNRGILKRETSTPINIECIAVDVNDSDNRR